MSLPYAFTDPADPDLYGMTTTPGLVADQDDAEHAGYTCGLCLDTERLAYTDGTESPCPNCHTNTSSTGHDDPDSEEVTR